MVTEAIDFRFLLLENYKKLKLSENELAVILMIHHLIDQGNPFINVDLLSIKMTMDIKTIDLTLASLLDKQLIEYVTQGKKTVTTLEPLNRILFREFQLTASREQEDKKSNKVKEELTNIYGQFEKLLERPLAQAEFAKIREWVSLGYSDETIIDALKEALSKGKKSTPLRSVDKILVAWSKRDDLEKESLSTKEQQWDKSLEETIRIAKTPWIDKDGND